MVFLAPQLGQETTTASEEASAMAASPLGAEAPVCWGALFGAIPAGVRTTLGENVPITRSAPSSMVSDPVIPRFIIRFSVCFTSFMDVFVADANAERDPDGSLASKSS